MSKVKLSKQKETIKDVNLGCQEGRKNMERAKFWVNVTGLLS